MAVKLSALRIGRRFALQKHYLSASGLHFCQRLSKSQGLLRPEGLGKLIKIAQFIGSRTHAPMYTVHEIKFLPHSKHIM
jgi:hypothetical protein